jgi:glycosyltransferase involved in cell wall biosynthesis
MQEISKFGRKQTVVHVIGSAGIGGIERLVLQTLEQQSKDERVVPFALICFSLDGQLNKEFSALDGQCEVLNLKSGYDLRFRRLLHARNVLSRFDVIHIHFFNPLVCLAAVLSDRPILYTEHGNFGFGRKRSIADVIKLRLQQVFLNHHVDFISFNSSFTKETAESRYGLEKVKRRVIYNGISLPQKMVFERFNSPYELSLLKNQFVVGTTCRFAGFKRVDRLIDGFSEFASIHEDGVLLLVGDGDLRAEYEKKVHQLCLAERVVFTGFQKNVSKYQSVMDVCVFPSSNEPFGLVAIEAYSLGKPVIVFSDGGGFLETVGKHAPDDVVDSPQKLSMRLCHYLALYKERSNPDVKRRNRLASESRREFSKAFSVSRMTEDFEKVYAEIA